VYYRTVVEYYSGSPKQWEQIMAFGSSLKNEQFIISGRSVDVSKAAFEVSNHIAYKGYVSSKFRGVVGAFMEYTSKAAPVEIALELMHTAGLRDQDDFVSRNEYLSDEIVSVLLSKPGGKELARHFSKPMRVQEYVIPEGATLYVSGVDGTASSPSEVVISDTDTAGASAREQAIIRMAIGGGLIVLSLVISVLILLS
jgi:hypothetical protein